MACGIPGAAVSCDVHRWSFDNFCQVGRPMTLTTGLHIFDELHHMHPMVQQCSTSRPFIFCPTIFTLRVSLLFYCFSIHVRDPWRPHGSPSSSWCPFWSPVVAPRGPTMMFLHDGSSKHNGNVNTEHLNRWFRLLQFFDLAIHRARKKNITKSEHRGQILSPCAHKAERRPREPRFHVHDLYFFSV